MKKTNQVAKKSWMSLVSVKDIKSLQDIINSIVVRLGVEHTLKAMSLGGFSWAGIRQKRLKLDWRVWNMPEDHVSTSTRLSGPSGASSVLSLSTYFSSCTYPRS